MTSAHPGYRMATLSESTIVVASSARNVASGTWSLTPSGDPCMSHSALALTTCPYSGAIDVFAPCSFHEPPIATRVTASTFASRNDAPTHPRATSTATRTIDPHIAAYVPRTAASSPPMDPSLTFTHR